MSTTDDWTLLEAPDHYFGWLPGPLTEVVRDALQETVDDQVPGAIVEWVRALAEPAVLTGGVRMKDDPSKVLLRRSAFTFPFVLSVLSPSGQRDLLQGAFTWVAGSLDAPEHRRDRTWFDLGMTKDAAAALLEQRIYEIDAAAT